MTSVGVLLLFTGFFDSGTASGVRGGDRSAYIYGDISAWERTQPGATKHPSLTEGEVETPLLHLSTSP